MDFIKSEEKKLRLIELVEKYPELYDFNHLEYYSFTKRDCIWFDIANKLGYSVAECKKQWTTLRNLYRKSIPLDNDDLTRQKKTKWRFHKEMEFLQPFITDRKTRQNNESSDLTEYENYECNIEDSAGGEEVCKIDSVSGFSCTFPPNSANNSSNVGYPCTKEEVCKIDSVSSFSSMFPPNSANNSSNVRYPCSKEEVCKIDSVSNYTCTFPPNSACNSPNVGYPCMGQNKNDPQMAEIWLNNILKWNRHTSVAPDSQNMSSDAITKFFEYVLETVKTFPLELQADVKCKIFKIVTEAEQMNFNTNMSS